jgi:hypothetical protein
MDTVRGCAVQDLLDGLHRGDQPSAVLVRKAVEELADLVVGAFADFLGGRGTLIGETHGLAECVHAGTLAGEQPIGLKAG